MNRTALKTAVALTVAASAAGARAAETYTVKVDRPVKVGQAFTVTCRVDVTETMTAKANGQKQPPKTEKYKAELAGTEKVEAVNEKTGGATKVTVTVDKLTKDGAELFRAGTVVTADHTGEKKTFTVDGAEVAPETAAVLDDLIDVDPATRTASDDEVFANGGPRAVGATWDADPAKVVEMLAGDDIAVTAEHVKASTKLVAVKPIGRTPSEVVESTISADSLEPGRDVGGLTLTDGSFTGTVTQTLPTDPADLAATVDGSYETVIKANDGTGAASVEIKSARTLHSVQTPKK